MSFLVFVSLSVLSIMALYYFFFMVKTLFKLNLNYRGKKGMILMMMNMIREMTELEKESKMRYRYKEGVTEVWPKESGIEEEIKLTLMKMNLSKTKGPLIKIRI
jgi:hypothetical protein